jgi:hypothetical protein
LVSSSSSSSSSATTKYAIQQLKAGSGGFAITERRTTAKQTRRNKAIEMPITPFYFYKVCSLGIAAATFKPWPRNVRGLEPTWITN